MAKKVRVDQLLVEQGLFPTRTRAQAALMAGVVYVQGQRVDKAGALVSPEIALEVRGKDCPYVSRGGLKLARGLDALQWDVTGFNVVDLGSSTGGFCDCLLQRGAAHVVAVDVGKGQLDQKIREDSRVTILDQTNARYLQPQQIPYRPDLVTVDVSFISLALLFPAIRAIAPQALGLFLIKPQFECGPKYLRKGVVRDSAIHLQVLRQVLSKAGEEGLEALALTHSPVKGPAGNIEFLAGFRVHSDNLHEGSGSFCDALQWEPRLSQAVENAHRELNSG